MIMIIIIIIIIIILLLLLLLLVVVSLIIDLRRSSGCGQSPYSDSGFQRVWLKHNLRLKAWNSHVHREFPGMLESSNLGRANRSREIGRRGGSNHRRGTKQPRGCRTGCGRDEGPIRAAPAQRHRGTERKN